MTMFDDGDRAALLTRAADAEVLDVGGTTMDLLADFEDTAGAVNANRARLAPGSAGPPPHYHRGSAELFFVLGGALRVLAGDRVLTLDEGDFLAVPRRTPHAFAALPDVAADVLVVFAPAIPERFEYFRTGERVLLVRPIRRRSSTRRSGSTITSSRTRHGRPWPAPRASRRPVPCRFATDRLAGSRPYNERLKPETVTIDQRCRDPLAA